MLIQTLQDHMLLQWMVFIFLISDVASDFYYALNQLYNTMDGCFHSKNLDIPATAPLFIFG